MPRNVPDGGITYDTTPKITVTLNNPLPPGATVQVLRGGTVVGTAVETSVVGQYSHTDTAPFGSAVYTARVVNGATSVDSVAAHTVVVTPVPQPSIQAAYEDRFADVEVQMIADAPPGVDVRWSVTMTNIGDYSTTVPWPVTWTPPVNYTETASTIPASVTLAAGASVSFYSEGNLVGSGTATISVAGQPLVGHPDSNLANNSVTVSYEVPVADDLVVTAVYHNNTSDAGDGMYRLYYGEIEPGTVTGIRVVNNGANPLRFDMQTSTLTGIVFNPLGTVINGGGTVLPPGSRVWTGSFEWSAQDIADANADDLPIGGVNVFSSNSLSVEIPGGTEFKTWQYNNLPYSDPTLLATTLGVSVLASDANLANNTDTQVYVPPPPLP